MCLILGGPKLVYAMSKVLNLPSIRTTQTKAAQRCVIVSVGYPVLEEVLKNLEGLSDVSGTSSSPKGYVLMVDKVALEERPRYDDECDVVLGLCWEDIHKVDPSASSLENLREIQVALEEGTVHRAKEATVASFAPFALEHYIPVPAMLTGTCKTEKDADHAKLLCLAIEAFYKLSGGGISGNHVFCIATDGDPVRRRAVHQITMDQTLPESSAIYRMLSPLPLMNLQCGPHDITADIDIKHVFKRTQIPSKYTCPLIVTLSFRYCHGIATRKRAPYPPYPYPADDAKGRFP